MKDKNSFEDGIKDLFCETVDGITMDNNFRKKLLTIKDEIKPQTSLEKFLEYEIRIPTVSVSAAALVILLAGGAFLNTLLLPGQIPQPKYQIIEMRPTAIHYNGGDQA